MIYAGIRELKNNLSRYIRQLEAGERIAVIVHGRVIAEIIPSSTHAGTRPTSGYEQLVASGILEPAPEPDEPLPEWPDIGLPPGTAAILIDIDRDER